MADYTDGLGWAKLDTTAACHLADCMDMFQGRAASKRRKMLLFCYSNLRGSEQPTFKLGFRTIAKACGVTNEAARLFLKFCKDNELFIEVGSTPSGEIPKRTFWWIAEGCVAQTTQGVLQTPISTTRGCVAKPYSSNTHQNTDSKRDSLKNLSLTCYVYGEEKFSVMAVYAFAKRSATAMQKDCTLDYIYETDPDFDLMMRAVIDDLTPEERIASYWENNEGKGERK